MHLAVKYVAAGGEKYAEAGNRAVKNYRKRLTKVVKGGYNKPNLRCGR